MIDFTNILKVALPVIGSVLLNEDISPKKQENPYVSIAQNAIDTIRVLSSDTGMNYPIQHHKSLSTPYEIAENKQYKYNFK